LPKYRADIDGLRAVAVLAVVAFHAFPQRMPGGFVGVDIFFVISGFLISTILLQGLRDGTFSFADFYARRIRRIFPALAVTLVAVIAFGWLSLGSDEFAQLGKHVLAGAGFVVNVTLWAESGYFDSAAAAKPLLHLWSLGIEEQFYILWPLVLWLAARAGVNWLIPIVIIGAASFIANVVIVRASALDAFYFPHTRFWELMVGAALAYPAVRMPQPMQLTPVTANLLSLAGLAMVVSALALINEASPFPGWWALLPTVGAALMIHAGNQAWLNRTVLSWRPMVGVGLISYPLYLWHWPLLAYARILVNPEGDAAIDPSRSARVSLVALAIALAWLTYKFVEQPIRTGQRLPTKTIGLVTAMLVVGVLGWSTYASAGFPWRIETARERHPVASQMLAPNYQSLPPYAELFPEAPVAGRDILLGHPPSATRFELAVIGDSHAWVLFEGLTRSTARPTLMIGRGTCAPLFNVDGLRRSGRVEMPLDCQPFVDNALDYLSRDAATTVIIVTAYFDQYDRGVRLAMPGQTPVAQHEALRRTLTRLGRSGKTIVLVYDVPEIPRSCYRRQFPVWTQQPHRECTVPRETYEKSRQWAIDVVRDVSSALPNIVAYDPARVLCDPERCGEIDDRDFLYITDGHHVNTVGARRLGADLAQFIERLLHSR
jgi:peptidoglycan/LPS O-acetylase OafA/YrhL